MATTLTVNGVGYAYPNTGDQQWGSAASAWALAVTNGMLQKAGGTFSLTADVNFGPTYGLIAPYFTSTSTSSASAGTVRMASADNGIAWRNNANSANLILTTSASDRLQFGAVNIPTISSTDTLTNKTLTAPTINHIISSSSNISSTGFLRMASGEAVAWRNNANNGNLALTTDASDNLTFNGNILSSSAGVIPVAAGGTGATSLSGHGVVVMNSAGTAQTTVAPGTSGNVLTSNGTDWTSAASAATMAVGSPVTGGGANQILFEDGSQNLASSSLLTYYHNGGPFGASPDLILGSTSSTDNEFHQLGATNARLIFVQNLGSSGSNAFFSIDTNPSGDGKTHFKVQDASGNSGEMFSATLGASPNVTFPSAITASVSVTTPIVTNSSGVAVKGANNNTAASAGYIGEILGPISRARASATGLTNNTTINVGTTTSITLTAGNWLVSGAVAFTYAATTTITELDAGISATSGVFPAASTIALPTTGEVFMTQGYSGAALGSGAADITITIPAYVVNVANGSTKTLYLVARGIFGVSTLSAYGSMYATRLW